MKMHRPCPPLYVQYQNITFSCPVIPSLKLICSSHNKTADAMRNTDSFRTVCPDPSAGSMSVHTPLRVSATCSYYLLLSELHHQLYPSSCRSSAYALLTPMKDRIDWMSAHGLCYSRLPCSCQVLQQAQLSIEGTAGRNEQLLDIPVLERNISMMVSVL